MISNTLSPTELQQPQNLEDVHCHLYVSHCMCHIPILQKMRAIKCLMFVSNAQALHRAIPY